MREFVCGEGILTRGNREERQNEESLFERQERERRTLFWRRGIGFQGGREVILIELHAQTQLSFFDN